MEKETIDTLFARFEAAAKVCDGVECWSARELCPLLGYTQWRNFTDVVGKAKIACKSASCDVQAYFADFSKIVKGVEFDTFYNEAGLYEPSQYVVKDWPIRDGMYQHFSNWGDEPPCKTGTSSSYCLIDIA